MRDARVLVDQIALCRSSEYPREALTDSTEGEPMPPHQRIWGKTIYSKATRGGGFIFTVDEDEGPFGEFTGYASERSTRNAVEVASIMHRSDAYYHTIVGGISDEHTLLLGIPQEARQLRSLRVQYPNITAVHYPKSGTCLLRQRRKHKKWLMSC